MARYILLMTLTPEGRETMIRDSETILRAERTLKTPDIQMLGLYGVLGEYDFVGIVEAPDNDAAARFSLELGVAGGVHITTLPAIPIARLEAVGLSDVLETESQVTIPTTDDLLEDFLRQDDPPTSRS